MRTLAGPGAHIHFTSLSKSSSSSLSNQFQSNSESIANTECHQQGILDLIKSHGLSLDQVCLLDPKAPLTLSPEDGYNGKFKWFLFGVRYAFFFYSSSLFHLRRLTHTFGPWYSQGILGTFLYSV